MDTILQLEGVSKTFRETRAVDRVTFSVERGEIFGFLGPNGAGKTTTIRMIMGIIAPDSGQIDFYFNNKEHRRLGDKITKKRVGYLPEERGLYSTGKILETIMYFANLKGTDLAKAREDALMWLEKMGLAEYRDKKVEELSKGMQQKVQFIVSIIHRPELVILDELFSGLDPVNQELFKEMVKELRDSGTTVLLSSHRMNLVEELCDRIFLINKGEKVLFGSLNEIKDDFGVERVWVRRKGKGRVMPNWPGVADFQQEDDVISFNLTRGARPRDIIPRMMEDLEIEEIKITKLPLHDIFIATVGGEQ